MAGFRSSKYYNNPQIGQVAAGLAQLFAPPSAGDVYAGARAQAARNEDRRLQMLFESSENPADASSLLGIQKYGDTRPGFTYKVDADNATERYKSDNTLTGTKYGADAAAEGAITEALVGALTNPDGRIGVSAEDLAAVTGRTGLPAITPALPADDPTVRRGQDIASADSRYEIDVGAETARGNNARDNRTAVINEMMNPDGRNAVDQQFLDSLFPGAAPMTAAGPVAPTKAQVEGDILAALTPEQQRATQMTGSNLVQTLDENGNPVYTAAADAAGQPAFVNKGAQAAPEVANWSTPDGQGGTAILQDGTWVDTQTKAPIPAGATTFNAQAQGSRGDVTGATTSNITSGNMTVADAEYGLGRLEKFEALLLNNPGVLGVPGIVRGFAQDLVAAADEFGDAYGTIDSVEEARDLAARVGAAGNYDPAIAQAASYALEMAYLQAKMQDPGGEVNVRELERLLGVYDGGIAGNKRVLANLQVLREQLNERKAYGENLRAGAPGDGAAAPPDDIPTVSTPEEAAALPSGTRFRDPTGQIRVVP